MADCRVGITQNLEQRRKYWEGRHPGLSNWRQVGDSHSTKSSAQEAETRYANRYGCDHGPGGSGPEFSTWYVYRFDY